MDADTQAEGYIRETLGNDIKEYRGPHKDEKHGKQYTVKTHILTDNKLSVLKKRFEIVSIIPIAGETYFNLNLKRIQ